MTPLKMFLYGCLGGCCPTFAKLAATYSTNPEAPLPVAGAYFGLLLFAVLGGIIARGFSTPEVKGALAAGIAAPALVTNIMTGAAGNAPPGGAAPSPADSSYLQQQSGTEDIQTASFSLFSAAHAQPAPTAAPSMSNTMRSDLATGRGDPGILHVTTQIKKGGLPSDTTVKYSWTTSDNAEIPGELSLTSPQNIVIPDNATGLMIGGQQISVDALLQQQNQLQLDVTTEPTLTGDFLWALGGKRSYNIQGVDLLKQ